MGNKKKEKRFYVNNGVFNNNSVFNYDGHEHEFEHWECPHYFSISGLITGCDLGPPDCENCTNPDKKIVKSTIKTCSITTE